MLNVSSPGDKHLQFLFPAQRGGPGRARAAVEGDAAICSSAPEFAANFGAFARLGFDLNALPGVVAAGGAVLAALLPRPLSLPPVETPLAPLVPCSADQLSAFFRLPGGGNEDHLTGLVGASSRMSSVRALRSCRDPRYCTFLTDFWRSLAGIRLLRY